jgi:hypothetical protein
MFSLAVFQPAEHKFIRIGMRQNLIDLCHNEFIGWPAEPLIFELMLHTSWFCQPDQKDAIHFQAQHGKFYSHLFNAQVGQIHIVVNPT